MIIFYRFYRLFLLLLLILSFIGCQQEFKENTVSNINGTSSKKGSEHKSKNLTDEGFEVNDFQSLHYCDKEYRQLLGTLNSKSIYYTDQRKDYCDLPIKQKILSRSIATLIRKNQLTFIGTFEGEKIYRIKKEILADRKDNICPDVRYYSSRVVGHCTAFLVNQNSLMTAGHCVGSLDPSAITYVAENVKVIFTIPKDEMVIINKKSNSEWTIKESQIFNISTIEKFNESHDDIFDYAIIKTSKSINQRFPLQIGNWKKVSSEKGYSKKEMKLFALGHPVGLTLKMAPGEVIYKSKDRFKLAIDTFHGNSGSPVFSAKSHKVIGILVGGMDDFVFDKNRRCFREAIYPDDALNVSMDYEDVLSMSAIYPPLMKNSGIF